jgi:5-methylcytosine-specific restriction endonuclease McrA
MTRSINKIKSPEFYKWLALRKKHLKLYPWCKFCLIDLKIRVPAEVVDHIKPHKGDNTLFLDPRNFQSLCKKCHDSKKQRAEKRGYSDEVDANGAYVDKNHPRYGF